MIVNLRSWETPGQTCREVLLTMESGDEEVVQLVLVKTTGEVPYWTLVGWLGSKSKFAEVVSEDPADARGRAFRLVRQWLAGDPATENGGG